MLTFYFLKKELARDLPVGVVKDVPEDVGVEVSGGKHNGVNGYTVSQQEDQDDHNVQHQLLHLRRGIVDE